jgi:periplasmic copper chaperone A
LSNVVRRTVLVALLIAAFAAMPAVAPAQETATLVVQNPWIRKPPPGLDSVALYFTVKNLAKRAVYIVGVTSPLASSAMIHETSMVEGQSRMRMRERVTVPGGSNVAFEPEGLHVMLTGVTKTLEVGDKVPVTLELDHGGMIDLVAIVRPLDAK